MMIVGRTRVPGLARPAHPFRTCLRTFWRKPASPPAPLALTAEEAAIDKALRDEMGKRRNWVELMLGSVIGGSLIGLIFNTEYIVRPSNWMSYEEFYQREREGSAKATEPQLAHDIVVKRAPRDPQAVRPTNGESVPLTRQIIKSHLHSMYYAKEDVEAALAEESALGQPPDVTRTLLAVHKRLEARREMSFTHKPIWHYSLPVRHVTFVIPAGAAADDILLDPDTASEPLRDAYATQLREIRQRLNEERGKDNRSLHVCTLKLETNPRQNRLTLEDRIHMGESITLFGVTTALATGIVYALTQRTITPSLLRSFATKLNPGLSLLPAGLFVMPFTLGLCLAVGTQVIEPLLQPDKDRYRGPPVKFANVKHTELYHYTSAKPSIEEASWRTYLNRYSFSPTPTTGTTTDADDAESVMPSPSQKDWFERGGDALAIGLGLFAAGGLIYCSTVLVGGIVSAPAMIPFAYLAGRRLSTRLNQAMVRAQARHRSAHPPTTPRPR